MNIRSKWECISVEEHESPIWDTEHKTPLGSGTAFKYTFQVVTGGSPENDLFFASTPGGRLEMYAVRDQLFTRGQKYYLDFSPAEA